MPTLAPPPAVTSPAGSSLTNYIISIILIVFVISVIIVSIKKK